MLTTETDSGVLVCGGKIFSTMIESYKRRLQDVHQGIAIEWVPVAEYSMPQFVKADLDPLWLRVLRKWERIISRIQMPGFSKKPGISTPNSRINSFPVS